MPMESDRRQRSAAELVIRVLATAGAWSVAAAISLRLRHPMITAAVAALAVSVTILIWFQPVRK